MSKRIVSMDKKATTKKVVKKAEIPTGALAFVIKKDSETALSQRHIASMTLSGGRAHMKGGLYVKPPGANEYELMEEIDTEKGHGLRAAVHRSIELYLQESGFLG